MSSVEKIYAFYSGALIVLGLDGIVAGLIHAYQANCGYYVFSPVGFFLAIATGLAILAAGIRLLYKARMDNI